MITRPRPELLAPPRRNINRRRVSWSVITKPYRHLPAIISIHNVFCFPIEISINLPQNVPISWVSIASVPIQTAVGNRRQALIRPDIDRHDPFATAARHVGPLVMALLSPDEHVWLPCLLHGAVEFYGLLPTDGCIVFAV